MSHCHLHDLPIPLYIWLWYLYMTSKHAWWHSSMSMWVSLFVHGFLTHLADDKKTGDIWRTNQAYRSSFSVKPIQPSPYQTCYPHLTLWRKCQVIHYSFLISTLQGIQGNQIQLSSDWNGEQSPGKPLKMWEVLNWQNCFMCNQSDGPIFGPFSCAFC